MDFRLEEPAWADLDRERPGQPFMVRVGGRVLRFRPATDLPAHMLLQVAGDWRLFLGYCVDNAEDLAGLDFAWWRAEHMLRMYRRHYGLCETPAEDRRLFSLMQERSYRDAVEADLQEIYRVDLGELWRARRWRTLLNYVERLRRATHFGEATAVDEKLAKLVLDDERKRKDGPPVMERRMSEFTVEAELLSLAVDRLGDLLQVQVAKRGGKTRPVKYQPRPKTAVAKMREKRDMAHVDFTLDRVFGRVDAKGNATKQPG